MANTRHYQLFTRASAGAPVRILAGAYSIRWGLRIGRPGYIDVVLPAQGNTAGGALDHHNLFDFEEGHWLEFYRTTDTEDAWVRVGPAPFLITSIEQERTDEAMKILKIHAETPLGVLARRINAYDTEDARSDFPATPADDFMKEIVRNNFLAVAGSHVADPDPLRDASSLLSVAADTSSVVNYEPDVANADILRALNAAADFAYSKNVSLFYDIYETGGSVPFQFRTKTVSYGADRSGTGTGRVTLDSEIDITSYTIGYNWEGSVNRVYAGGRGATGSSRLYAVSPAVPSAEHTTLQASVAANPFSLRERFESSSSEEIEGIQADADSARISANTVFRASGKLSETSRYQYGIDFDFGDKLNFAIDGINFVGYIVSEIGTLDNGQQEVLEIGFSTDPLPRAQATGVAGIISDLSRITTSLEKIARTE